MRQKLLFYIDASVSSRFSSFILESQSHISSQNRGEMQGLLERNQCLEQPFCYARRNWGKSFNTCTILWLGLLWAKMNITNFWYIQDSLKVWMDLQCHIHRWMNWDILSPLCPFAQWGWPWEGGTLLLSFWPGIEILMVVGSWIFISSNNMFTFLLALSEVSSPYFFLFLSRHTWLPPWWSMKCHWHGWKAPVWGVQKQRCRGMGCPHTHVFTIIIIIIFLFPLLVYDLGWWSMFRSQLKPWRCTFYVWLTLSPSDP